MILLVFIIGKLCLYIVKQHQLLIIYTIRVCVKILFRQSVANLAFKTVVCLEVRFSNYTVDFFDFFI